MATEKDKDKPKEAERHEEAAPPEQSTHVTQTEKRGVGHDEEVVKSSHPDAANEVPAEPDPSVAHPQPDDGMDSVLVNPEEVVGNDDERGTEHRP